MSKFFEQLAPYLDATNVTITVSKTNADTLTVSVLPIAKIKDSAKDNIAPMIIRGTIDELEEGFFDAINEPLQDVTGIVVNITQFEKGKEELAEKNKAAKELKAKKEKLVKTIEDLFKKEDFEKALKKAEELQEIASKTGKDWIAKIEDKMPKEDENQVDLFNAIEEVQKESENKMVAPTPVKETVLPESPAILESESRKIENSITEEQIEVMQQEQADKYNSTLDLF
jgi:PRTRC genetic system protein E